MNQNSGTGYVQGPEGLIFELAEQIGRAAR
jgi:hypothetical protein